MDDANTALAVWKVAQKLRLVAVGRWFYQNRNVVIMGTILSMLGIVIAADPESVDDWGALLLGIAVMAPAGYYSFFLLLRLMDLFRAARGGSYGAIISRAAFLLFIALCCIGSFVLGAVVVTETFSWIPMAVIGILALVNATALIWLRLPTVEGKRLLNEIDGFREYLQSVEKLPMDQPEAPARNAGLYEEYLPYAVALEVEQRWADNQLISASFFHEEPQLGVRPFYLGTWDGKPIEIVYKPSANSRHGW